jgi:hypothetical protein
MSSVLPSLDGAMRLPKALALIVPDPIFSVPAMPGTLSRYGARLRGGADENEKLV